MVPFPTKWEKPPAMRIKEARNERKKDPEGQRGSSSWLEAPKASASSFLRLPHLSFID